MRKIEESINKGGKEMKKKNKAIKKSGGEEKQKSEKTIQKPNIVSDNKSTEQSSMPAPEPEVAPEVKANPFTLPADATEEIGFTIPPALLCVLTSIISLLKAKGSEFSKIVLNFDGEKVWWYHKLPGRSFLINFGFFTYNYVEKCWGTGRIALSASKLREFAEAMKGYKSATFWSNNKDKTYGVRAGSMTDDIDIFTALSEPIDDSVQPANPITFDKNWIPVMKDDAMALKYGCDLDISQLRTVVERGKQFATNIYPFNIMPNPPAIKVSYNNIYEPKDTGANQMNLVAEFHEGKSTLNVPPFQIERSVGELLESVVYNYKGIVSLRFAQSEKSPIYILKVDKTEVGLFVSGVLLGTKKNQEKDGKTTD